MCQNKTEPMNNIEEVQSVKSDAIKAALAFLIINLISVVFFLVGKPLDDVAFVFVFVQIAFFAVWLLPYFIYQVLFRKRELLYAFYKTLSSYKDLWTNFTY